MVKGRKSLENQGIVGLNPDQERAVRAASDKPLLIVAGAGTGKTATLTQRVAFLIKEGVPGDSICAITFTNKAAKEMESRIAALNHAGQGLSKDGRPFIGTFHALGARILRRHAALLERTPNFVIFDDHDSFALVKRILKELDRRKENPGSVLGKISSFKSDASLGLGDLRSEPEFFQAVFTRYEYGLQSHNAFDFDDLLSKVVVLFKTHPAVLRKYQEQFTHILIDEYQDLNDVQYELVRLLSGDRTSISVVGDAEQTIYGWRGSNINIFLRFPEDWKDAAMVTLTQNYRSTQNILAAASGVIQNNRYDTKVERATNLWTENGPGEPVSLIETYDEEAEAQYIGDVIARSADTETAILYRTNAQSRALEQALLRRRIPYRVYGGLKFYERREIKDVVAALRYSLNQNDVLAKERLERAFSKRLFKVLAEALEDLHEAGPLVRINTFLKTVDYMAYMERHMTNPRERRENIEELIHFAGRYEDASKLLEEISLLQSTDAMSNDRKEEDIKVSLMTVHLAKGLEFDRVFVAGVSEGLIPHARSIGSPEELQEERRLMYVAMTRARKKLYLCFYDVPSRFLGEIPEDVLVLEGEGPKDRSFKYADEEYEERYISLD